MFKLLCSEKEEEDKVKMEMVRGETTTQRQPHTHTQTYTKPTFGESLMNPFSEIDQVISRKKTLQRITGAI